jgi:hypothetical protein
VAPDNRADAVPPPDSVLLVDDAEQYRDTALGDALLAWVRASTAGVVVAARSDVLAVSSRGLGAELRSARCGVLLQPGPLDTELFGARPVRHWAGEPPGRGLLVPDPAWRLGREPIPIQVACVDPERARPDQPMCG